MAKKKLSNRHHHNHEEPEREPNHCDDNGEQSEKIRSLKSLKSLLLKETAEKRLLLDSLERSKDGLENEVRTIGTVAKGLKVDLSVVSAECVGMDVERSVMRCFLETWKGEIREDVGRLVEAREEEVRDLIDRIGEIGRVLDVERGKAMETAGERDVLLVERGELVDRSMRLRDKLEGVEEARTRLGESLEVAKRENEKLWREKVESKGAVEGFAKEKEAVAEELAEVGREVGQLRGRVEELKRVNKEIGREKKRKEDEIGELDKDLARFNEVVTSLQVEGGKLRSRLFELESLHAAALEKVKDREREIGALVEENVAKEADVLDLKGACDSLENKLSMAEEELEGKERSIEAMEKKRIEMEELVKRDWKEIAGLNGEAAELKDTIAGLESSCRDREDKIKGLLSEVSFYREALDGVRSKKDEIKELLAEERQNVVSMASKLPEMEKKIEETTEGLRVIRGERDGLVTKKAEEENKLHSCVEEKAMLEERLSGAQQTTDNLKAKIELVGIRSEQISIVLKKTVVSLVKENGGEENFPSEQKLAEDFRPYARELNAIRTAFRNKECAVEELKQQLEVFKESAARARKEKGLWTLLSSVTTLVAAASVAYLARRR